MPGNGQSTRTEANRRRKTHDLPRPDQITCAVLTVTDVASRVISSLLNASHDFAVVAVFVAIYVFVADSAR